MLSDPVEQGAVRSTTMADVGQRRIPARRQNTGMDTRVALHRTANIPRNAATTRILGVRLILADRFKLEVIDPGR
jgi:hypothetical protein